MPMEMDFFHDLLQKNDFSHGWEAFNLNWYLKLLVGHNPIGLGVHPYWYILCMIPEFFIPRKMGDAKQIMLQIKSRRWKNFHDMLQRKELVTCWLIKALTFDICIFPDSFLFFSSTKLVWKILLKRCTKSHEKMMMLVCLICKVFTVKNEGPPDTNWIYFLDFFEKGFHQSWCKQYRIEGVW